MAPRNSNWWSRAATSVTAAVKAAAHTEYVLSCGINSNECLLKSVVRTRYVPIYAVGRACMCCSLRLIKKEHISIQSSAAARRAEAAEAAELLAETAEAAEAVGNPRSGPASLHPRRVGLAIAPFVHVPRTRFPFLFHGLLNLEQLEIRHTLTPLGLQSRFGDKLLEV